MKNTLYPNQIDNLNTYDVSEAVIAIENILGTNPSGPDFSTLGDRLSSIDKNIKSLLVLSSKEHLYDLKLSTLLSLGNSTDGYDLVLGEGDAITAIDNVINICGNTIITGELNILNDIDLNNNSIKNLILPTSPNDASNKQYVDLQLINYTNELYKKIEDVINNDNCSIQYTNGKTQPFPNPEADKFLKRKNDNSGWEFVELDLDVVQNKIDSVIKSIGFISKNITNGDDLTISIGDAIRGEDDYINIDSNVVMHKTLVVNGDIDLQSHNIINSMPPKFKSDLTNKQYVDTKIQEYINSKISIENQKNGSILYFDNEKWVPLPLGEENDILMIKNNKPIWTKFKYPGKNEE